MSEEGFIIIYDEKPVAIFDELSDGELFNSRFLGDRGKVARILAIRNPLTTGEMMTMRPYTVVMQTEDIVSVSPIRSQNYIVNAIQPEVYPAQNGLTVHLFAFSPWEAIEKSKGLFVEFMRTHPPEE